MYVIASSEEASSRLTDTLTCREVNAWKRAYPFLAQRFAWARDRETMQAEAEARGWRAVRVSLVETSVLNRLRGLEYRCLTV